MTTLDMALVHAHDDVAYAKQLMVVNLCETCIVPMEENDMAFILCTMCTGKISALMRLANSVVVEYCLEHTHGEEELS